MTYRLTISLRHLKVLERAGLIARASARFAGVEQARAVARPVEGGVDGLMPGIPADRPGETTSAPVIEPPGVHRA